MPYDVSCMASGTLISMFPLAYVAHEIHFVNVNRGRPFVFSRGRLCILIRFYLTYTTRRLLRAIPDLASTGSALLWLRVAMSRSAQAGNKCPRGIAENTVFHGVPRVEIAAMPNTLSQSWGYHCRVGSEGTRGSRTGHSPAVGCDACCYSHRDSQFAQYRLREVTMPHLSFALGLV